MTITVEPNNEIIQHPSWWIVDKRDRIAQRVREDYSLAVTEHGRFIKVYARDAYEAFTIAGIRRLRRR